MAPQRRGVVPDKLAAELAALADQRDETKAAIERAVLKAFKAGASTREIAALLRMDGSSVHSMGVRLGWPDEKELARRAAVEQERHRYDWMREAKPQD